MTWDNTGYGTHLPALVWTVTHTSGPVCEIGAGEWSTPLLHQLCHDRDLVTIENDPEWSGRFTSMRSDKHHWFAAMPAELRDQRWAVVLVDNDPECERVQWLDLDADFFVVHDSQLDGGDDAARAAIRAKMATFEVFYEFTDLWPHTAIVSNRHGVYM